MVRKAKIEDAERLAEIHIFGWRNAYRKILTDKFLFDELRVCRRAEGFKKVVAEGLEELYVAERQGVVAGFLSIGEPRDADKTKAAALELWAIYVDPVIMREGVGAELLEFCEQQGAVRGRKEVFLWVLEENAIGRSFYKKHGYVPDGTRKVLTRLLSASGMPVAEVRYVKAIA
ncbi:MAG: hypothetical protein A2X35_01525 [Elusimicrobia bacterium GWA2_61_42]|nr:MAG: hypothetical protein A2X35_01525 [Elusimicrobia bacterium GWA2_61_42]OGR76827.1 MAG: hypothetical protein A2X38_11700 [Elusimicrobia bacterium GWC2_61_25]